MIVTPMARIGLVAIVLRPAGALVRTVVADRVAPAVVVHLVLVDPPHVARLSDLLLHGFSALVWGASTPGASIA